MAEITLQKCLKLAIVTEQLGARFYERMAHKFADNRDVGQVFAQLSKDEVSHESYFKTLLDKAPPEASMPGDFETQMVLRATAISEFFRQDAFKKFEDIDTPQDALTKALSLEKSTLFYYMTLKETLGEQPQLDELIKAERGHVAALMKVILTNAQFRGLADTWE